MDNDYSAPVIQAQPPSGGSAFPYQHDLAAGLRGSDKGMSLRDWFAGMALQGRLTLRDGRTRDEIVEDAYMDADAMLAERAKGGRDA